MKTILWSILLLLTISGASLEAEDEPIMLTNDAVLIWGLGKLTLNEWHETYQVLKAHAINGKPTDAWSPKPESYEGYHYQLLDFVSEGKHIVMLNALCGEIDKWEQNFIQGIDGGNCYFSLLYDKDRKKITEYFINNEP